MIETERLRIRPLTDDDLGLTRVVAVVRPGNTGSKRVLSKVGMRHVADEHHYGEEAELWEARSTTSAE